MPADPHSLLPLRPVEFLLLVALAESELHGYALTKEITERSHGLIRLEPGNLYRVIKRLAEDGLVEAAGRRDAADAGAERRLYYRITALGRRVASAEASRLRALLATPSVERLMAHGS